MLTIWFRFMSLRSRSLAFTPIASDRARTVMGGSISALDLRVGASATRWPPRDLRAPRPRRDSSSSESKAAAGTGEVTRRSVARSLLLARRPARSAAEPRRLPRLSPAPCSCARPRPRWGAGGRPARGRGPPRGASSQGRPAARPGAGTDRPACRRAGDDRRGRPAPTVGRARWPEARSTRRTSSGPSSRHASSTSAGAAPWAAGPTTPSAPVRSAAAAGPWARPRWAAGGWSRAGPRDRDPCGRRRRRSPRPAAAAAPRSHCQRARCRTGRPEGRCGSRRATCTGPGSSAGRIGRRPCPADARVARRVHPRPAAGPRRHAACARRADRRPAGSPPASRPRRVDPDPPGPPHPMGPSAA